MTCVGAGALFAARVLPVLHHKLRWDATVASAMLLFAIGLAMMAWSSDRWIVVIATLLMGCGWMITLTTLNTAAQMTLPNRMRARGMSCYLTALAFSMSLGSLTWGSIAEAFDVAAAQKIAAVTVMITAAIGLRFRIVPDSD